MNVSSIIVKTSVNKTESVLAALEALKECEVQLHEGQKIIITIEAENIDSEISTLRTVEKIDGVAAAEVAYSYSEDELESEREKIELAPEHPEWLNDDSVKAENIKYKGDLRKMKK